MKDEPDIVKELRESEKLGILQSKVQSVYKDLEEISIDGASDGAVHFAEDEEESQIKDKAAESKQADETCRIADEDFRRIVEKANAGIVISDLRGRFIFVNEALCRMIGYSKEELIRRPFKDFLHPDDKKRMWKIFLSGLKNFSREMDLEFRGLHKKGHIVWMHCKTSVLLHKRKLVGFFGVIADITKQKRTEIALHDSENKYRMIIDTSLNGIYQVDNSGKFTLVNKSFARTLGYNQGELIGKEFTMLLFPDRIPQVKKWVEDVFSGKSVQDEVTVKHKDGHELVVYFSAVPIKEESKIVGLSGNLMDITKRKKTEENLEKKIDELERYKKITVDREMKMIELKMEINELCKKLGEEYRYNIDKNRNE